MKNKFYLLTVVFSLTIFIVSCSSYHTVSGAGIRNKHTGKRSTHFRLPNHFDNRTIW